MTYQEQIHAVLGFMYNETKCFATSSTYHIPYSKIVNAYSTQVADKKVQSDIRKEWCDSKYMDKIQALDFDDIKQEVVVMIWETNNKRKKYTLKNYKEFCEKALICPPFEDEENWQKWIDEHKIQIIANGCEIELDYDADVINEIEFSLREIHNAILGDGTATTGNTVGSEYPNATWKDILRFAVWYGFCEDSHDLGVEIQKCIESFYRDTFAKVMKEIEGQTSYNDELKVNFFKLETKDLWKLFDEKERRKAFKEILCSNVEIEELYDKDGKCADKVVITDYSIHPSGHLVGWHYGVDWDKDSEDNQYYIQNYIEEMIG
ncbi:MAG: hypothetical protein UHD64_00265 [Bacteroidales bacterium]|nr:hypothetical protein [Bacteroidales bacterium]